MNIDTQREIDLVKLAFGQFFGVFLPYILFVAVEFSSEDRAAGYDYMYYSLVFSVIISLVYFMAIHFQTKVLLNEHEFPVCKNGIHDDVRLLLRGNRCWQYLTPVLGFWWFDNHPKLYRGVKAVLANKGYLEE
ncbi:hypothetical protein H6784_00315 [Candidatus Nomurabacteria bacterium]|nr:hypothetical protein [Candidatus Kaiserbacteria bacterium]MCB9813836.1 hypothetical protein [Candidatus Nomurabacteria bacterium]